MRGLRGSPVVSLETRKRIEEIARQLNYRVDKNASNLRSQHSNTLALLLAWAPIIGDALCLAAGWLRLHWLPCCLFMAIGKLARYWLVAQSALSF